MRERERERGRERERERGRPEETTGGRSGHVRRTSEKIARYSKAAVAEQTEERERERKKESAVRAEKTRERRRRRRGMLAGQTLRLSGTARQRRAAGVCRALGRKRLRMCALSVCVIAGMQRSGRKRAERGKEREREKQRSDTGREAEGRSPFLLPLSAL